MVRHFRAKTQQGGRGGGVGVKGPVPAAPPVPSRIRTADLKICGRLRYQSTRLGCYSSVSPHCLEPSERKLLTPHPPPPTLKKLISSFRG